MDGVEVAIPGGLPATESHSLLLLGTTHTRKGPPMQGVLDHLESASHGHGLLHLRSPRQVWTRRFVRLNHAFQTLEVFTDTTLQQRVLKLELANAEVATADELGELLFSKSRGDKIPVQHTRRFVFRVAASVETAGSSSDRHAYYFCAEQPVSASDADVRGVDATASRKCLDHWLRALRAAVQQASTAVPGQPIAPVDLRDVHAKLASYTDELFVSSHVTARRVDADDPHKRGLYELTVHAWTLQRELVPRDGDDTGRSQWQVLEYACAWTVAKSSTQLRDFDAQLRLRGVGDELRDLALPSFSGVRAFFHKRQHDDDDENRHRVARVDAYWQKLLCLPAFSVFGSDGGAMLDTFLEISRHLAGFKTIETASGQNLNLRKKRVVPWRERETFEQLFHLHQEMVRVDDEKRNRLRVQQAKQQRRERDRSERSTHHHHHHHHHRSSSRAQSHHVSEKLDEEIETECVAPPPAPVPELETTESVHERIARIGHKLLVEAFNAPTAHHVNA